MAQQVASDAASKIQLIDQPDQLFLEAICDIDKRVFNDDLVKLEQYKDCKFLVWYESSNIAGYLAYKTVHDDDDDDDDDDDEVTYIQSLAVVTKHQRSGIGRQLMNKIIQLSKQTIMLSVDVNWKFYKILKKFYAKLGFIRVGKTPAGNDRMQRSVTIDNTRCIWQWMIQQDRLERRDNPVAAAARTDEEKANMAKLEKRYKEKYGDFDIPVYNREAERQQQETQRKNLLRQQHAMPNPPSYQREHMDAWFDKIKQIGPDTDPSYEHIMERRDWYHNRFGWVVPSREAIQAIVDFTKDDTILEVGAGIGFWGMLICGMGGKLIATDVEPDDTSFIPVEQNEGLAAILAHPECNTLLSIWPHPCDNWICATLAAFKGTKFILVGEPITQCGMGCTDVPFQTNEGNDTWKLIKTIPHPNFTARSQVNMYQRC